MAAALSAKMLIPRPFLAPKGRLATRLVMAGLLGVTLTAAMFFAARVLDTNRVEASFQSAVRSHMREVLARVDHYEGILIALRMVMQSSDGVGKGVFAEAAADVFTRQKHLLALEWAPRVSEADRESFENLLANGETPGFRIFEAGPGGERIRAGRREEYFPVTQSYPGELNRHRIGFDLGTVPGFELWREAARKSETVAGSRSQFEQGGGAYPSLAVAIPVYRPSGAGTGLGERGPLDGFVQGVFHLDRVMAEGTASEVLDGIDLLLLDLSAAGASGVLYAKPGSRLREEWISSGMLPDDDFVLTQDVLIGMRSWRLVFRAMPFWITAQRSLMPQGVAVTSALVAVWIFMSMRRGLIEREEIEHQVSSRTHELTLAKRSLEEQIQERLHAEQGLLRTQYKLMASQRLGRMGSWERDLEKQTLVWSDEVYSIFGRSKDDFQPTMENFIETVYPEDRSKLLDLSEVSLKSAKPFRIEYRILIPDGSIRHVVVHAEMIRGEDGRMTRIQGAIQDITYLKRNELLLLEAQSQLVSAQRLGHIGSWEVDFKTNVLKWSDETFRICGYVPGEFEPTQERFYSCVHPEDIGMVKETEIRVVREGTFSTLEHRLIRPDGTVRWVVGRSEVQRDSQGKAIRALGTIQDVTEAKESESRRQALDRNLVEVQKLESLGLMAGGVAHDFNNLLSGIMGSANLVRAELPKGSLLHEHLERVETAAQRAADLTAQMLAYAGQGKLATKALRLPALVRDCLLLMQASVGKRVVIELELDPDTPVVVGDASQIRMLVANLVLNAAEAMSASPGTITISTHQAALGRKALDRCLLGPGLPEGNFACLGVRDGGEGIEPVVLSKMFDPFFTTRFKGRGLGLAAVLGIVRSHGGAIAVETSPGKGSYFAIYLPESDRVNQNETVEGPKVFESGFGARHTFGAGARARFLPRRERRG